MRDSISISCPSLIRAGDSENTQPPCLLFAFPQDAFPTGVLFRSLFFFQQLLVLMTLCDPGPAASVMASALKLASGAGYEPVFFLALPGLVGPHRLLVP